MKSGQGLKQGRDLETGTDAEAMKEYCLLACFPWLARPPFLSFPSVCFHLLSFLFLAGIMHYFIFKSHMKNIIKREHISLMHFSSFYYSCFIQYILTIASPPPLIPPIPPTFSLPEIHCFSTSLQKCLSTKAT